MEDIIPEHGIINMIDSYKYEMEFVVRRKIIDCDRKLYRVFRTIKRKYISMKNTIYYLNEYDKKMKKPSLNFMINILNDIKNSLDKYNKLNEELFKIYYNTYIENEYILKKMSINLIDIVEKYIIVKKYIIEMEVEIKVHVD